MRGRPRRATSAPDHECRLGRARGPARARRSPARSRCSGRVDLPVPPPRAEAAAPPTPGRDRPTAPSTMGDPAPVLRSHADVDPPATRLPGTHPGRLYRRRRRVELPWSNNRRSRSACCGAGSSSPGGSRGPADAQPASRTSSAPTPTLRVATMGGLESPLRAIAAVGARARPPSSRRRGRNHEPAPMWGCATTGGPSGCLPRWQPYWDSPVGQRAARRVRQKKKRKKK